MTAPGATPTSRPNIIAVLVDDQGYGDLSLHGHPEVQTPHLDALARDSVHFSDFHVAPMCTPTRGSMLTGLDPLRHGATNVSSGRALLSTELTTLPDVLKSANYRTGIFGKWHLGDNFPYRPHDRGFDRALWFPSSHVSSAPDRWRNDYFDTWLRSEGDEGKQYSGYCTDILFDQAYEWIREDSQTAGQPFFAYVSLNALHQPLIVADKYREPYLHLGPLMASYLGMIANLDENIGRMEQRLRADGLADDTIVIFLSDNGGDRRTTELYNSGMRGSKTELWEGGHRVPAFLRWPKGNLGGEQGDIDVSELVMIQDLMPTLLDLCGIPASNLQFDGHSIVSLMKEHEPVPEALAGRTAVMQYSRMASPEPTAGDAVVMRDKWRLMVEKMELYNIETDPGQVDNIAHRHPQLVSSMSNYYGRWWEALSAARSAVGRIVIGDPTEPEVALSSSDWRDVFIDQQRQILEALEVNGPMLLTIATTGSYRFSLYRWPRESGLAMTEAASAHQGEVCEFMEGKAIDIAKVKLNLNGIEVVREVQPGARSVEIDLDLFAGPATMRTALIDSAGRERSGAYYVYVDALATAATA